MLINVYVNIYEKTIKKTTKRVVVSEWKKVELTPLCKSADKFMVNNYRRLLRLLRLGWRVNNLRHYMVTYIKMITKRYSRLERIIYFRNTLLHIVSACLSATSGLHRKSQQFWRFYFFYASCYKCLIFNQYAVWFIFLISTEPGFYFLAKLTL